MEGGVRATPRSTPTGISRGYRWSISEEYMPDRGIMNSPQISFILRRTKQTRRGWDGRGRGINAHSVTVVVTVTVTAIDRSIKERGVFGEVGGIGPEWLDNG